MPRPRSGLLPALSAALLLAGLLLTGPLLLACAKGDAQSGGPAAGSQATGGREPSGGAPASAMNVLLITVDTMRPDHMSGLGYSRPTTPHLDAVIRRGVAVRQGVTGG